MKILMCWLDMERPVARIELAQVTKPNTSIQTPTVDSSGIVAGILCIRWGLFFHKVRYAHGKM
jgi:hypothetical protein